MKLRIEYKLEPLIVSGQLSPVDYEDVSGTRELFIDDKPVPPALADIILLGISVAAEQYLDMIDRLRNEVLE